VNGHVFQLAFEVLPHRRVTVDGVLLPSLLCECGTEDCGEFIALDFDQYKAIRSLPTLFVVGPGHETLQVENVAETNDRYALVENTRRLELVTESHQPIAERQT
jgi:hypothetical protein